MRHALRTWKSQLVRRDASYVWRDSCLWHDREYAVMCDVTHSKQKVCLSSHDNTKMKDCGCANHEQHEQHIDMDDSRGTPTARGRQCRMSKEGQEESEKREKRTKSHRTHKSIWINESSVNPKSTSNQSSKPCTALQYPSRKVCKPRDATYTDTFSETTNYM